MFHILIFVAGFTQIINILVIKGHITNFTFGNVNANKIYIFRKHGCNGETAAVSFFIFKKKEKKKYERF